MKNTHFAKTLTASLPSNPRETFSYISDPNNLPAWYSAFCRGVRSANGVLTVESPRGAIRVKFLRDDHTRVLDIQAEVADGIELSSAIRLLPSGEGSELIWTLLKPEGLSDAIFHEHLRWAGSALHALRKERKITPPAPAEIAKGTPSSDEGPAPAAESSAALPSPADAGPLTGKKLFIGNLTYDWTDDQLRAHFAESGTIVLAEVARFRGRGGRSRGFGFVEMSSESEAQTAIEKLHGQMAGGRQLVVRLAKSQESRPPQSAEPTAKPLSTDAPAESTAEKPEPGNERFPARSSSSRSQRSSRSSNSSEGTTPFRGRPAPRRGGSNPRGGTGRSSRPTKSDSPYAPTEPGQPRAPQGYQEQDISNKSGYEIFPRRRGR